MLKVSKNQCPSHWIPLDWIRMIKNAKFIRSYHISAYSFHPWIVSAETIRGNTVLLFPQSFWLLRFKKWYFGICLYILITYIVLKTLKQAAILVSSPWLILWKGLSRLVFRFCFLITFIIKIVFCIIFAGLDNVTDFLMKPCMHLVQISIFSLNNVTVRLTKIMNRADKNWAHF